MKALISNVGDSLKPLSDSIEEYQPEFVCFYYPRSSEERVEDLKQYLEYQNFNDVTIPVDDPGNFRHCYEKANEAVNELAERNVYPNDTLLDYTGGTKIMSSALVAATLGKGFRYALIAANLSEGFRYIYMGEERKSDDGLGFIEGGMEEVLASENPWEIHELESKKRILRNFNSYRYRSVIDQIDTLKNKGLNSERDEYLLDSIRELAAGYSRWDKFHYEEVKEKLSKSTEDFTTYKNLAQPESHLDFSIVQVEENIEFLSDLQSETFGFDFEKSVGESLAVDMFWNAVRRAEEGKYDDGIVRLYRTVEMFGQIEIYAELSCHTDEVPLAQVPEVLRDELSKKSTGEGTVELGLRDNFRVLRELGNELGKEFSRHKDDFKKIMRTRNTSFLTHNYKAIEKDQFQFHRELIEDIFEVNRKVEFPKLELT